MDEAQPIAEIEYKDKLYSVFNESANFLNAQQLCRNKGDFHDLALIKDANEYSSIVKKLTERDLNKDHWWIGLHRSENITAWIDNDIYNSSQPLEKDGGDCFALNASKTLYEALACDIEEDIGYICSSQHVPLENSLHSTVGSSNSTSHTSAINSSIRNSNSDPASIVVIAPCLSVVVVLFLLFLFAIRMHRKIRREENMHNHPVELSETPSQTGNPVITENEGMVTYATILQPQEVNSYEINSTDWNEAERPEKETPAHAYAVVNATNSKNIYASLHTPGDENESHYSTLYQDDPSSQIRKEEK